MLELHGVLAWPVVAAAVLALLLALATATGRVPSHRWLDRSILVLVPTTLVAAAFGLAALVTDGPPADPLHVVYGIVAVVAVPVARYAGRDGPTARIGRFTAIGAAVVLGALLRLFMTGR